MPKTTLQALESLTQVIESLEKKIDLMVPQQIQKPEERVISEEDFLTNTYPVPTEYLELVRVILNERFKIQITPLSDTPAFQFTVIVPEEYSNASPSQKQMYKYDLRPKVISFAEGVNGVREWCEKVYRNFNPETQAKITADRILPI